MSRLATFILTFVVGIAEAFCFRFFSARGQNGSNQQGWIASQHRCILERDYVMHACKTSFLYPHCVIT